MLNTMNLFSKAVLIGVVLVLIALVLYKVPIGRRARLSKQPNSDQLSKNQPQEIPKTPDAKKQGAGGSLGLEGGF